MIKRLKELEKKCTLKSASKRSCARKHLRESVRPSQRKEMAQRAVGKHGISIRFACVVYGISQSCYHYHLQLDGENAVIADWLLRLTKPHKRWGFDLCFLYLRNVKGFGWNHKRVYRIHRELELSLRIKPKRRIKQDKPDALSVPAAVIRSGR